MGHTCMTHCLSEIVDLAGHPVCYLATLDLILDPRLIEDSTSAAPLLLDHAIFQQALVDLVACLP